MRRFRKILLWTLGSILGLLLLLFGVAMVLLSPGNLTPIVKSVAERYLNAEVSFKEVDVSLFADFPLVSLELKDACVVSYALGGRDTLVVFKDFSVSIDALKLMGGKFAIRSVSLAEPNIVGRVDSSGRASWDIIKATSSSTDTTSTELDLNIRKITIDGECRIELTDERNGTFMHACWRDLSVGGNLSTKASDLTLSRLSLRDLHANITSRNDSLKGNVVVDSVGVNIDPSKRICDLAIKVSDANFIYNCDTLANKLRLGVNGGIYLPKFDSIQTKNLTIDVNGIATTLNGYCVVGDSTIRSDMSISSPSIGIVNLLGLVPGNDARAQISKIHSNISFGIEAKVDGTYNLTSGALPNVDLKLSAPNGSLTIDGQKDSLKRFALSSTLTIKDGKVNVGIEDIDLYGSGIDICASGRVDNLLGDPYVDGKIKAKIDLGILLARLGDINKYCSASGVVGFDGGGKFRVSQLNLKSLANTTIDGKLSLSHIKFKMPSSGINAIITGRILVGTNTNRRDTSMVIGSKIVGLQAIIDTVDIDIADVGSVNGRGIDVWATTAAAAYADKNRKRIHPFRGHLKASRLDGLAIADSSRYRLRGLNYDFKVLPSANNDTIPILLSDLRATSFTSSVGLERFSLRNLSFIASAQVVSRKVDLASRKRRLDSLQRVHPGVERDSLVAHSRKNGRTKVADDELASGDIDMKVGGEFLQLLRRWKANGRVKASRARLVSSYIPLRTNIKKFDISFDNNRVDLHSFHLDVGHSDMDITGSVSNLRQVLAGRGVLQMRLNVKSDTLDFTQLITSINSGFASREAVARAIDSIGSASNINEEQMEAIIAQSATTAPLSNLIVVPKNLELKAVMNVGKAIYGSLVMDSLTTELISKNHILQIKQLSASSNIGRMSLGAIYATKSIDDITTSFDLELQQVKVAELLHLIPDIDTMLPMMASFEGVVDCKLAARARLDTSMNLIIPTLDAAGSIKGHDMVLLDGETFTEIAKMLKFKNRERNYIDSISVHMRIKDSKVEIFPFILTLDRYQTAVSGVQNLDMSFNYHISVLKSIVPFRLGINIFGNLDNWKFRLVKAKYKSDNIPSYSTQIDSMRINLRQEISSIFTPR